jgi:hypothetical protein
MNDASMTHRWKLRATSVAFFFLLTSTVFAQDVIYKCGNELTNNASRAKQEKCKLVENGASVTIPNHQRATAVTKPASKGAIAKPKAAKAQPLEQQKRDSDAKVIIAQELKKTETQLQDLQKNHAQLTAAQDGAKREELQQRINRAQADIVSLKRELSR